VNDAQCSSLPASARKDTPVSSVLLVEDDADYAELVRRRLVALGGLAVHSVSCLRDAREHLASSPADCVLLDLALPDASGLEALLATRTAAPQAAVIVLTGNDDEKLPLQALVEGAQDYILKSDANAATLDRAIRYATERKRQENELAAREGLSRAVLDSLSAPTVLLSETGRIVAVNEAWRDLQREGLAGLGEDYIELCRRPPTDLPPAHETAPGLAWVLAGAPLFELDYSCGAGDERRWYSLRITPLRTGGLGAVVSHIPITRLKLAEEELAHLALHDQLTGLPNRRLFFDRLSQALGRALRVSSPLHVIDIDIDHFKSFNDSFGHAVGDEVLAHVARTLEAVVRPGDTVARLAGDEFVLLVEDAAPDGSSRALTSRLTAALREPFKAGGRMLRLTASIGVATSAPVDTPEEVLARADAVLYTAKRHGRDRVAWETEPASYSDALTRQLPAAIVGGELELYAQPIVRIPTGATAGHELLVRWRHPERGLLLPSEFIPEAERSGAIIELGRWVLSNACRALAHPADGFLSINVSAAQLHDPALLTIVRHARDEGRDVSRLCLEITESAVIADLNLAHTLLSKLRALGVRIAIDDFGAGQTSLRYLHDLPVDVLKIDRSLVSRLGGDDRARLIVTAVVELGRALGLDVVGEGAETTEQAEALRHLGCQLGQGFRWAEPQPLWAA
jgi:diguanylate cyclase (GGDEF)-like protein